MDGRAELALKTSEVSIGLDAEGVAEAVRPTATFVKVCAYLSYYYLSFTHRIYIT